MQADLRSGKAAFQIRSVGLSVAILAGATLSLSAPERALAACGASHPAGVHAAGGGTAGVHVATSTAATSGGSGGGGTLGCAGGSSASALRGLPTTTSGRVVETGAHAAARSETHARTAATKTTNASAHLRTVGHHA